MDPLIGHVQPQQIDHAPQIEQPSFVGIFAKALFCGTCFTRAESSLAVEGAVELPDPTLADAIGEVASTIFFGPSTEIDSLMTRLPPQAICHENRSLIQDELEDIRGFIQNNQELGDHSINIFKDRFVANLHEAVKRVNDSLGQINESDLGGNGYTLSKIEVASGGDPHKGGRRTCFVTLSRLENGVEVEKKIVYKPRNMESESLLCNTNQSIFSGINFLLENSDFNGRLATYNFLCFEDFGFVEFISRTDVAESEEFSSNCGMLECVAQIFGITDLNRSNLILAGNTVVPIDLEVCFDYRVMLFGYTTGLEIALSSFWDGSQKLDFNKESFHSGLNKMKEFLTRNIGAVRRDIIPLLERSSLKQRYTPVSTLDLKRYIFLDKNNSDVASTISIEFLERIKYYHDKVRTEVASNPHLEELISIGDLMAHLDPGLNEQLILDRLGLDIPYVDVEINSDSIRFTSGGLIASAELGAPGSEVSCNSFMLAFAEASLRKLEQSRFNF